MNKPVWRYGRKGNARLGESSRHALWWLHWGEITLLMKAQFPFEREGSVQLLPEWAERTLMQRTAPAELELSNYEFLLAQWEGRR